jgi:transposase
VPYGSGWPSATPQSISWRMRGRALRARRGACASRVPRYGDTWRRRPRLSGATRQASVLDAHLPYLRQRWADGCHNALQLWRELRERGSTGTSRPVLRWAEAQRTAPAPTTPRRHRTDADEPPAPRSRQRPSVPRLAWLLVRDPAELDDTERQRVAQLQAASAAVVTAYPLLQAISRLIKEPTPAELDDWLQAAAACDVPAIVTFAAGLQREWAALLAALRLPWSTGPVAGQITRLKLVKRRGHGRAGLETLKRRFLRAA